MLRCFGARAMLPESMAPLYHQNLRWQKLVSPPRQPNIVDAVVFSVKIVTYCEAFCCLGSALGPYSASEKASAWGMAKVATERKRSRPALAAMACHVSRAPWSWATTWNLSKPEMS